MPLERHRLVGLENVAVIAELWKNIANEPSNEEDIVRVEDDFMRAVEKETEKIRES